MDKSPEAFRTISEVAELLDTPAHVLRFWESRFPQIRPVKRAGGRRYYRPSDVALLAGIRKLLHDDGMTIRGVQKVLREHGVRHVAGLSGQPLPDEIDPEAALERALAETWPGPVRQDEPAAGAETAQIVALEDALRARDAGRATWTAPDAGQSADEPPTETAGPVGGADEPSPDETLATFGGAEQAGAPEGFGTEAGLPPTVEVSDPPPPVEGDALLPSPAEGIAAPPLTDEAAVPSPPSVNAPPDPASPATEAAVPPDGEPVLSLSLATAEEVAAGNAPTGVAPDPAAEGDGGAGIASLPVAAEPEDFAPEHVALDTPDATAADGFWSPDPLYPHVPPFENIPSAAAAPDDPWQDASEMDIDGFLPEAATLPGDSADAPRDATSDEGGEPAESAGAEILPPVPDDAPKEELFFATDLFSLPEPDAPPVEPVAAKPEDGTGPEAAARTADSAAGDPASPEPESETATPDARSGAEAAPLWLPGRLRALPRRAFAADPAPLIALTLRLAALRDRVRATAQPPVPGPGTRGGDGAQD